MLDTARRYTKRGWSVIPVPYRSKNPGRKGWQNERHSLSDLDKHFGDHPTNIGVLTGEPSNWLIDVDLDHSIALELAPKFLPPTRSIFGRPGSPKSHWIYQSTGPIETKKYKSKSLGMIVELRSTGAQTVFPPSIHESGEQIEWAYSNISVSEIEPEELRLAVHSLASAAFSAIGEPMKTCEPKLKKKRHVHPSTEHKTPFSQTELPSNSVRQSRCIESMIRLRMIDSKDGSARLFASACRTVEHDLNYSQSISAIRQYALTYPFPTDWTDEQIAARLKDAEKVCQRRSAYTGKMDENGIFELGAIHADSGRTVLSAKRTLPTAEAYVRQFHTHVDGRTLHCHTDRLMYWNGSCYVEIEDESLRSQLQLWLHEAVRYVQNRQSKELELVPFESNPATVKSALESIKSYVHLDQRTQSPMWLHNDEDPPASEFIPCKSELLHLPTLKTRPSTPAYYSTCALDFDYSPNAPKPCRWFSFLDQLLGDDHESVNLLQEWFGYCLTPDTSQQKMMLIVGPKRSGKGTIARVLGGLIGRDNSCAPTTSSLAMNFGLQTLLGKSIAIVSDARFSGEGLSTVVERLLCISGEDAITVDRKFMTCVTTKLPTRFMFLTNELPRLSESSGALSGRFVTLQLTKSFYDREDTNLTASLLRELPGILIWAIAGWRRLHERGSFLIPKSVMETVRNIEDLASPIGAFVREHCVIEPGQKVFIDEIFERWQQWCRIENFNVDTSRQQFGRDLQAHVAGLSTKRGTKQRRFYVGIGLAHANDKDFGKQ